MLDNLIEITQNYHESLQKGSLHPSEYQKGYLAGLLAAKSLVEKESQVNITEKGNCVFEVDLSSILEPNTYVIDTTLPQENCDQDKLADEVPKTLCPCKKNPSCVCVEPKNPEVSQQWECPVTGKIFSVYHSGLASYYDPALDKEFRLVGIEKFK